MMSQPSPVIDYAAGAVAGCCGLVVGHPFDTTKVQLQTRPTRSEYKSTWDAVCHIHKQGWVQGFFRGLSWPLLSYGLINSVYFGVYGNTLKRLTSNDSASATYTQIVLAGSIGGAAQLIPACPVEVVKVVLQSQIPQDKNLPATKRFTGPADVARTIIRSHGFAGIYRGFSIQAIRDIPASASYFLVYEWLKHQAFMYMASSGFIIDFFAGGCAGVISWAIIIPFDVIKSRMQADFDHRRYWTVVDAARDCYHQGGVQIFSRGLFITSLRAFPTNATILSVYSYVMGMLAPPTDVAY